MLLRRPPVRLRSRRRGALAVVASAVGALILATIAAADAVVRTATATRSTLVVEVLSPSNSATEMMKKLHAYQAVDSITDILLLQGQIEFNTGSLDDGYRIVCQAATTAAPHDPARAHRRHSRGKPRQPCPFSGAPRL